VKALACGAIGGVASLYLLKRRAAVDLFGMDLPEWQADGVLLAVSSVSSDLIGCYAVPYVERQIVGNQTLEKVLKYGLPPALTAGTFVLAKQYGTDTYNTTGSEVLLSATTKLVVDGSVERLL
jgi:hypothetical protein